ncbi:VanW family protein [Paenibacillus sp. CCS19]|uniref:VanW family protein n=1 Tax=Paenibacillus sp. CCS19 TaxID=3158387 RepID=UPI00295E2D42|nr:VanW family protein [Paenibacillus cellulosilyticus]
MTTRKMNADSELAQYAILAETTLQMSRWKGQEEINARRFHNMHTACTLVDGVALKPNEVFSLRRFLKDSSGKLGFQEGPVIINGEVVFATGGSVCAVATLVFDAALKANLAILEKHNHSTDMWGESRFIHLGGDAAYVYGRKDLKFRNSHNSDIIVKAAFDHNNMMLSCRIYALTPLPGTVRIDIRLLQEIVPPEQEGHKYRNGCIVSTRRYLRMTNDRETLTYSKNEVYQPFRLRETNE